MHFAALIAGYKMAPPTLEGGAPFWILPLIAMLTNEPEMLLQPVAFCKHTMHQNATAPRTALGELTALPRLPRWF